MHLPLLPSFGMTPYTPLKMALEKSVMLVKSMILSRLIHSSVPPASAVRGKNASIFAQYLYHILENSLN